MRLYHGTTAEVAEKSLKEGIKPRITTGKSNWKHTISSNPSMVYLTSTYAPYFALCAATENQRLGLIEIESNELDENWMRPDEDFIEQASQYGLELKGLALGKNIHSRTKSIRDNIDKFKNLWKPSIEHLGNCAYKGIIPPSAITRIVTVDRNNPSMEFYALDPIICIENFSLCKEQYQVLTQWFMGKDVSLDEWLTAKRLDVFKNFPEMQESINQMREIFSDRSGIKEVFSST